MSTYKIETALANINNNLKIYVWFLFRFIFPDPTFCPITETLRFELSKLVDFRLLVLDYLNFTEFTAPNITEI